MKRISPGQGRNCEVGPEGSWRLRSSAATTPQRVERVSSQQATLRSHTDRARSEPEPQWKTRGNRIRQLIRLGVSRRHAILNGLLSHGDWRVSKTPVINQAVSTVWLRQQGLVDLTEKWIAIHYPTTVR